MSERRVKSTRLQNISLKLLLNHPSLLTASYSQVCNSYMLDNCEMFSYLGGPKKRKMHSLTNTYLLNTSSLVFASIMLDFFFNAMDAVFHKKHK